LAGLSRVTSTGHWRGKNVCSGSVVSKERGVDEGLEVAGFVEEADSEQVLSPFHSHAHSSNHLTYSLSLSLTLTLTLTPTHSHSHPLSLSLTLTLTLSHSLNFPHSLSLSLTLTNSLTEFKYPLRHHFLATQTFSPLLSPGLITILARTRRKSPILKRTTEIIKFLFAANRAPP